MNKDGSIPQDEVDHYLRTGESDTLSYNWPGRGIIEKGQFAKKILTDALIDEVRRRSGSVTPEIPSAIDGTDTVAFTRAKVEPMVKGLFPRREQEAVLNLLEQSLVFLTPDTIEPLIRKRGFLSSAWKLANIYLGSIGAETLSDEDGLIVGYQEETICYVSMEYFYEDDPFADYVVHEAAHIFHNTKRETIGLPSTRYREWLLPIEFRKRETFAYACEVYSQILELAKRPSDRKNRLNEFKDHPPFSEERVDHDELLDIKDRYDLLEIDPDAVSEWILFAGEDIGALVRRKSDGQCFCLGLAELEATDRKSANYQLLDDYAVWFVNNR